MAWDCDNHDERAKTTGFNENDTHISRTGCPWHGTCPRHSQGVVVRASPASFLKNSAECLDVAIYENNKLATRQVVTPVTLYELLQKRPTCQKKVDGSMTTPFCISHWWKLLQFHIPLAHQLFPTFLIVSFRSHSQHGATRENCMQKSHAISCISTSVRSLSVSTFLLLLFPSREMQFSREWHGSNDLLHQQRFTLCETNTQIKKQPSHWPSYLSDIRECERRRIKWKTRQTDDITKPCSCCIMLFRQTTSF